VQVVNRHRGYPWLFFLLLVHRPVGAEAIAPLAHGVVVNEIHYDPDVKTEAVEFIELYNAANASVDLGGWSLVGAVSFAFPAGTRLAAQGFLVVAGNPAALQAKFGAVALGPWVGRLSAVGETVILCDAARRVVDRVEYALGFPWPTVGDSVPSGTAGKGCSIQLVDPGLDNSLAGSWRSAFPTPGIRNAAVWVQNPPPQIDRVAHDPIQPVSRQTVTVTARVLDTHGVEEVGLSYQAVDPGAYVAPGEPAYKDAKAWTRVAMADNGTEGDAVAGDGVYTVVLPASLQGHRRLIRYRITATDRLGASITVPYGDDPQPNFAYFVYEGVPAWRGAVKPGDGGPRGRVVEFGTGVMRSLPACHLIAKEAEVLRCQYDSGYENTLFTGTLVCDGIVYDPVQFKVHGEWSTYVSGKNKWRFFFTRGHDLHTRGNDGLPYEAGRKVMDLSACAVPWVPVNRGMAGVDEAAAFALYDLAGVPSPKTHFLQLRVIDQAAEASSSSQYEGDLWGLYLAIEHPDGRFLDEHGLADGNLYKYRKEGQWDTKNQGATQPANQSDLTAFRSGYSQANTVSWWRANLNLEAYYSFVAVNRAINNMDLREPYNVYYYHDPVTNLWTVIPWDLDMLYLPVTHWSGVLNIQNCLSHPEFEIGYQNRGREIQDLLLSAGQVDPLIDGLAAVVNPPDLPLTFVDVDRAMWDWNPRTTPSRRGTFYQNPCTHNDMGGQSIIRTVVSADHAGMMQWIKDFVLPAPGGGSTYTGRGAPFHNGADFLDQEVADPTIPETPVVTSIGPAGYPSDNLRFRTTPFDSPVYPFKGLQWRIAEVADGANPASRPGIGGPHEIRALWTSSEMSPFRDTVDIPGGVADAARLYRVRCRMKDLAGQWSHWSNPVEFVAGAPLQNRAKLTLQVSEIMYHAPSSIPEDGWDRDDLEFIELMNTGSAVISLSGVRFTAGISFDFAGSSVTQLIPGQYVLVVKNRVAFECRYGTLLDGRIAGEYRDKLSDGGERVGLTDLQTGVLADFEYKDGWYASTDGQGMSLVLVDPAHVTASQMGQKASWRASTRWGGSPGAADTQ
jgi:hypothetical protein